MYYKWKGLVTAKDLTIKKNDDTITLCSSLLIYTNQIKKRAGKIMEAKKELFICACGNVLGCCRESGVRRYCETTQPGDTNRTFGCTKEEFIACTMLKDMIAYGDASCGTIKVLSGSCRHCPPVANVDLSVEEQGPVAYLSD